MADVETWKNVTKGTAVVVKYDQFGKKQHEIVRPGKTVALTKSDRLINQEIAATKELDMFSNGMLTPVQLLDDNDVAEFAANPNIRSDEDLKGLLDLHWKTFESEIATITSVAAVQRLRKLAEENDATVRKVQAIESRLIELGVDID